MTLSKQQRHNDLDRYWMETVSFFLSSKCFVSEAKALYLNYLCIVLTLLYLTCFAAVVFNWRVF